MVTKMRKHITEELNKEFVIHTEKELELYRYAKITTEKLDRLSLIYERLKKEKINLIGYLVKSDIQAITKELVDSTNKNAELEARIHEIETTIQANEELPAIAFDEIESQFFDKTKCVEVGKWRLPSQTPKRTKAGREYIALTLNNQMIKVIYYEGSNEWLDTKGVRRLDLTAWRRLDN